MVKYILKRLLYIVFVFFIISIVMFCIYKAVPGDPARLMIEGSKNNMDPVRYETLYQAAREKLGLDQPIYVQYFSWMRNMLMGDFGYSIVYKMPVVQMAGAPMTNTIKLNVYCLIFVFIITIPLGIATAVHKKTIFDNTVQVFSIIGYSLPGFIVALIFIYIFAIRLKIFPISGVSTPGFTGTPWEMYLDGLKYMALPLFVMVFSSLGGITRYVRAAMIDALRMDYIRTARAKGVKEKVVIYSHAFRNALIPVVTILTGWFLSIFSGSVVIERIFLWNGMGKVMLDSLNQQDFAVVLAFQMFYVLLALAGNLIMDLAYCLVDPRVKLT